MNSQNYTAVINYHDFRHCQLLDRPLSFAEVPAGYLL